MDLGIPQQVPITLREAESAIKTAKILQQDDDFIALMAYWCTPISATGVKPAELIMRRRIRTIVPAIFL